MCVGGVDLFDLRSGAYIRGWNTAIAQPSSYTMLDDFHMVLSANTDRSTTAGIQVWNWRNSSNRSAAKCLLSEKVTCWSSGPDSIWLAGGSPSGTIYIWEVATGIMVRRIESGHYKAVSAMATTTDGAYLITGGEDRMVNIWLWADLVMLPSPSSIATGVPDAPPSAICTLSDHAGKITSIHVGAGGVNGRIVTSSDDRTCKLWDLPSKVIAFYLSMSVRLCWHAMLKLLMTMVEFVTIIRISRCNSIVCDGSITIISCSRCI
jgi:pre-rRNA-processing protein IPI3